MPALVIGGVTVPVARDGASRKNVPVGDRDRAYDGSPVSDAEASKAELEVRSAPLAPALATSLRTVLQGAMPVACSGDLLGGAVNCDAQATVEDPVKASDGPRWVFHLVLRVA